jgi:sporulation protein YlmC with PRC-barrel domain
MKKGEDMRKLWALVIAVIFMGFASVAFAVDPGANSTKKEEALVVKNWKGEYIGSVQHVLSNSSTGDISFVILSLDKEKKEIVIPLASFSSFDQENGIFILNVSKEILREAPEFRLSDLKDPAFAERVYRFFGEAPPWTDRPQGREMRT